MFFTEYNRVIIKYYIHLKRKNACKRTAIDNTIFIDKSKNKSNTTLLNNKKEINVKEAYRYSGNKKTGDRS